MDIYLTLYDLGLIIVFILAVVGIIYFIITMKKVYELIGGVQRTLKTNEENINKTLSTLPEVMTQAKDIAASLQVGAREFETIAPVILHNVSDISSSLKEGANIVVHSVDVIGTGISETVDTVSETVNTVRESSDDAINLIKIIVEAVQYLVSRFSSR